MKRTSRPVITGVFVLLLALSASAATVNCTGVAAWSPNSVSYAAGALVTENGNEYKCLQSHTSQAGWDPASVPALWSLVGTCGTTGATPTPTPKPTASPTPKGATPTPTPKATPTPTAGGGGGGTCWAAWVSTTAYTGGSQVSYLGVNYQAAYWTQGNTPSTSSGPAGSGQPWINEGSCSGSGGGGATPTPTAKPTATSTGGGGGGGGKMFAPYADISLATGELIVSNASAAGLRAVTLAFLVDGGCTATWGGLGGTVSGATFPNGTSVSSAINSLISNGVSVIISWGGANGSVASSCSSASSIQAMYQSVFTAYPGIAGQDFDIEGGINTTAVAQALAGLKSANPGKQISLTLPVLPTGLVSAGLSIVSACHSAGFQPDTVNVMAMDYGSGTDGLSGGATMGGDADSAASATHGQTGNNIGVTPMIGVNDTSTEVFQLSDAQTLVNFANSNSYINRLAMWSLGRDNGGCAGQGSASATCSGISQSNWQYSSVFNGF